MQEVAIDSRGDRSPVSDHVYSRYQVYRY